MCSKLNNSSLIIKTDKKYINFDQRFLDWLVGFTDAEGNFNISLKGLKDEQYNNLILTYQIDVHINDILVLEYIRNKLNCGYISKSTNRCNYFVNDQKSLINIISPIFKYTELKSSKYSQYLIFEKTLNLVKCKKHLLIKHKLEIIKYFKEMKVSNKNSVARKNIPINKYWLIGFTEGDATFSTNKFIPRLKFENHKKELELFLSIKNYLKIGNLSIISRKFTEFVILDINKISILYTKILPLYKDSMLSKKSKDFIYWSYLVQIYYYGYHVLPISKELIKLIKLQLNNKLITNNNDHLILKRLNYLFSQPSPYIIKNNKRFYRNTNNLVSDSLNIICQDNKSNIQYFNSIYKCSLQINISRKIIKNCLITNVS